MPDFGKEPGGRAKRAIASLHELESAIAPGVQDVGVNLATFQKLLEEPGVLSPWEVQIAIDSIFFGVSNVTLGKENGVTEGTMRNRLAEIKRKLRDSGHFEGLLNDNL